jgi:putative redox protein
MSDVTTKVVWTGEQRFTATNADGLETVIDGKRQVGPSPVEVLVEALGACTAVDVVLIMEKVRTPLSRLEVTLVGDRHSSEPRYLLSARVRFDLWGEGLKPTQVERAISLSFDKYCSVYHSLRPDLKARAEYRLHGTGAVASGEYQAVGLAVRDA